MSALISFVDIGIERLTLDFELWCWVITGVITGVGSLFFFLRDIGVDLFFCPFRGCTWAFYTYSRLKNFGLYVVNTFLLLSSSHFITTRVLL
jgi:hypothetical protein